MEAEESLEPKFHVQEGQILTDGERWMCSGPSRSDVSSPAQDILPRAMGKGGKLQTEAASPGGLGLGGQGDLGREISELDGLVGSIPGHISVLVGNCPAGKSRDFHPNL